MKRSNAKGLVIVLVALMVLTFISPAIVSADSPSVVPTTLAIGKNNLLPLHLIEMKGFDCPFLS